jgi:hypothetical protein
MMLIPASFCVRPDQADSWVVEAALRLVPLPYFFLIVLAARRCLRVGYGGATGVSPLALCHYSRAAVATIVVYSNLTVFADPVIILLRNFLVRW